MRTILITGASDGIGKSIALRLSKDKCNLILFGRDQTKLNAVKAACEKNGSSVKTFAFDISDNAKRTTVVDEILAEQPVDVLINNAGLWQKVGELTSLTEEEIQEVISVNLTAQILLTQQLLGQIRSRQGTAIINVVSRSGIEAQAGQSVYTASKYGLRGFTDILRVDTKEDPVRIGAVFQSGTNTEMFRKAGEDFNQDKFTDPDDLADVVAYMLSRPPKIWLNEVRVVY